MKPPCTSRKNTKIVIMSIIDVRLISAVVVPLVVARHPRAASYDLHRTDPLARRSVAVALTRRLRPGAAPERAAPAASRSPLRAAGFAYPSRAR